MDEVVFHPFGLMPVAQIEKSHTPINFQFENKVALLSELLKHYQGNELIEQYGYWSERFCLE
jgi:hypothetical protein